MCVYKNMIFFSTRVFTIGQTIFYLLYFSASWPSSFHLISKWKNIPPHSNGVHVGIRACVYDNNDEYTMLILCGS